jgi:GNAT superfamily N-acetyltransferase
VRSIGHPPQDGQALSGDAQTVLAEQGIIVTGCVAGHAGESTDGLGFVQILLDAKFSPGSPAGFAGSVARVELRQVRLIDPLVAPLLTGLAGEYDERYGENDEMATVDAHEFDPPSGTFVVLIDGDEVLAGGGLRRVSGDTCEVKRMWTAPGHRRKGYASLVLTGLEDFARAVGYETLLLETGALQPEAIALYTGRGYRPVAYYGRYPDAHAFRFDLR